MPYGQRRGDEKEGVSGLGVGGTGYRDLVSNASAKKKFHEKIPEKGKKGCPHTSTNVIAVEPSPFPT